MTWLLASPGLQQPKCLSIQTNRALFLLWVELPFSSRIRFNELYKMQRHMSSASRSFVNGRLSIKAFFFHFPFRHTFVCVCVCVVCSQQGKKSRVLMTIQSMTVDFIPVKYPLTDSSMLINYPFNLPLCTGPSNAFSSLPFRNMYSFKIWRLWIVVLAILAGVVPWRYKDWDRPQIPWPFTGYYLTLLEFSLVYLNQTHSVPKTIISTCIFTCRKMLYCLGLTK